MRLYEIPEAFRAIDAAIDEAGGELTPELEAELSRVQVALEEKVDGLGCLITESDTEAAGYKEEADRLTERASAAQAKADRLRRYLLDTLKATGRGTVKGRLFTAAPRKAGTPSIRWTAGGDIPGRFQRVRVELDGTKAREAHKAGELPAGFTVSYSEFLSLR